jgi:hypothetical protein
VIPIATCRRATIRVKPYFMCFATPRAPCRCRPVSSSPHPNSLHARAPGTNHLDVRVAGLQLVALLLQL